MAKKYTLNEVRQLKYNTDASRTSAKAKKGMFWRDLDDIEDLVEKFATLMRDKMFDKAAEGYSGWDNEENKNYITDQLRNHVEKGDYIDVANIAMMLFNFRCK